MKSSYVQRKRVKGWKMPPNTIYCGRPSHWGNMFTCGGNKAQAVKLFRKYIIEEKFSAGESQETLKEYLAPLRGHDLSCWCKPGDPCHVQDVLIPLVNREFYNDCYR